MLLVPIESSFNAACRQFVSYISSTQNAAARLLKQPFSFFLCAEKRIFGPFLVAKNLTTMTRKTLSMGKGAVVSALAKCLHPLEVIRKKYRNAEKGKMTDRLRVIHREEWKIQ